MEKYKKNIIRWIIVFICLIIFIGILQEACEQEIMKIDVVGYDLISKYLINQYITPFAKIITQFGGAIILIAISIISIIIIKNKRIGIAIFLNLIVISLLNWILKNIVQRPRPNEFRLIDERGYSFPSGHSMISMAFYGFIIYLIYKNIQNKYIKCITIIILSILIFLIGLSRIYLGVHYTSDVLAGFLISIAYLNVITSFIKNYINNKEMEKNDEI